MTVQDSPSDHARSITPSTISPLARTTEIGYSRWTSTARAGLNLLGVPEATVWVVGDWIARRRPPLREHAPYFIFILTINVFFCLVLPTQSLRNVKASHHIDLAYLYYLPFCSVFTSKDNFHAQIVPLFLGPMQTFMNGIDFKEDLKKLNAHYSALSEDVLKTGLINFAAFPPDDRDFFVTRMWDTYLPPWRDIRSTTQGRTGPGGGKARLRRSQAIVGVARPPVPRRTGHRQGHLCKA